MFIYLPFGLVLRSIYGTTSAGVINFMWGSIFVFIGSILWITFAILESIETDEVDAKVGRLLSGVLAVVGLFILVFSTFSTRFLPLLRSLKFWTYPLLFILSPCFPLLVKLRVLLPHNIYVRRQKQVLSLGESALEAGPQLALQVFIVLTRFDRRPSWFQWTTMTASLLALVIPSVENLLTNKNIHGGKNIAKYFPVFFLNTVFRVVSLSIMAKFFRFWIIAIWVGCVILLFISGGICQFCNKTLAAETDFKQQWFDGFILSFITVSNLENTRAAIFWRRMYFYWTFMFYSTFLLALLVILNVGGSLPESGLYDHQKVLSFSLVITITAVMGLLSLAMDFFILKFCCRYQPVFGNGHI